MKKTLRTALGDPDRLVALLSSRLSLGTEAATDLVTHGAVEVDGRRATSDRPIALGARVIVFMPEETPSSPLVVAYEDARVIVVDKPAGLRSQAVRGESWETLIARVQREIDVRASLLHRLDRDTSGLVLLPRSDKARGSLQAALVAGEIDRRYIARVRGKLDTPRTISLSIARDAKDPRRRVPSPAGEPAVSEVAPIEPGDESSLVALSLHTGRTHQLRVHLSAIGHPILGDVLYEGPPASRLCLHAHELSFPDPRGVGGRRTVTSPVPPEIAQMRWD